MEVSEWANPFKSDLLELVLVLGSTTRKQRWVIQEQKGRKKDKSPPEESTQHFPAKKGKETANLVV